jgi:large subunit ribosomal protein L13
MSDTKAPEEDIAWKQRAPAAAPHRCTTPDNFFDIISRRTLHMKSYVATPSTIERKWYVVDAEGKTLGRLAAEVANVLRGKKKPIFTPFIDTGDYVIVVNAEKVVVTGKKLDQKKYFSHTEYVGGVKEISLRDQLQKHPERVIEHAVKGMLPKGPLGDQMYKKLHVYAGPDHCHQAQKPEVLDI